MAFEYGPEDYNYVDFVMSREMPLFEAFRDRLHVGEKAPDFELTRLDDGAKVKLSEGWAEGPLVIEFGSFT